ncbi:MAG: L-aspartate oxidase [Bacteroidetes bacterium]|jgi:L-aspartate oxidase|nr:L-aspartate oxidase [Bacteroidota bacterium]MDF2453008.1 L-aspartate oxidase [Bacteroidota bacterium]
MQQKVDFLIIGSGIAGLSYALKVADHGSVFIVTKSNEDESNTKYAQGGIAAVWHDKDSIEKHIQDTLIAGGGLCDEEAVRVVVTEGTERVRELIELGANFDKKKDGDYDLAKEGGHSEHRILHHKDITGYEIERALLTRVRKHKNITILDHHYSIDIITQHHLGEEVTSQSKDVKCFGAYILDTKTQKIETVLSKITMMATGGAGHVYATTTNPVIATGDGIAMVYRAKGRVKDMEFVQFHPTSLYNPGEHPSFLITEAIRGFGAVLKTLDGKEFMHKYDERLSLAPRDIVARAIDNELKTRGEDFVYLDCRHIDRKGFIEHFPNIYEKCMKLGVDPFIKMIPVVPAMHYLCGGIQVNKEGQSTIHNLFAVGECACTGLHGANRLASNSLLEAVVFAHRAAKTGIDTLSSLTFQEGIPNWDAEGTENAEEMILITQSQREVQQIMSNYVGIVRSELRLKRAFDRLEIIYKENEALYEQTTVTQKLCELRNLICIGYLIIKHAIQRKESVGLHYMVHYKEHVK